jgi:hypothetical protein
MIRAWKSRNHETACGWGGGNTRRFSHITVGCTHPTTAPLIHALAEAAT